MVEAPGIEPASPSLKYRDLKGNFQEISFGNSFQNPFGNRFRMGTKSGNRNQAVENDPLLYGTSSMQEENKKQGVNNEQGENNAY